MFCLEVNTISHSQLFVILILYNKYLYFSLDYVSHIQNKILGTLLGLCENTCVYAMCTAIGYINQEIRKIALKKATYKTYLHTVCSLLYSASPLAPMIYKTEVRDIQNSILKLSVTGLAD